MTKNKPHVREFMKIKDWLEVVFEYNARLDPFYNPKPINLVRLFY